MGLTDVLRSLAQAIDKMYERRIRAASLVKEYRAGGHGHAEEHHEAAAAELRHGQAAAPEVHAAEPLISDGAPRPNA